MSNNEGQAGEGEGEEAFNPDPSEDGVLRDEIAAVVEVVARDGLPGPRDLDVALDAIMCSFNQWLGDVAATRKHFSRSDTASPRADGQPDTFEEPALALWNEICGEEDHEKVIPLLIAALSSAVKEERRKCAYFCFDLAAESVSAAIEMDATAAFDCAGEKILKGEHDMVPDAIRSRGDNPMRNLTPQSMLCEHYSCPGVYQLEDGRLLIVGATASGTWWHPSDSVVTTAYKDLVETGKIADTETAIVIHPDLLADIPEITRLRAENAVLREALGPFAAIKPTIIDGDELPHYWVVNGSPIRSSFTADDLRQARAALSENE